MSEDLSHHQVDRILFSLSAEPSRNIVEGGCNEGEINYKKVRLVQKDVFFLSFLSFLLFFLCVPQRIKL